MITFPASSSYNSPEEALWQAGCRPLPGVMKATARMEITDKERRYPLKTALMVKMPSSVRLESIPLIGPPDLFVSLDAGEMRIYIPSKRCFCIGAATPRNIYKFLPVDIGGAELPPLLLGIPGDCAAKQGKLSGRQEGNLYRIDRPDMDNSLLSIWIDPLIHKIIRIAFQKDGRNIYDAAFEKHENVGEYCVPRIITISAPESGTVKIRYSDLHIVPDTGEQFSLPIPRGVATSSLDR